MEEGKKNQQQQHTNTHTHTHTKKKRKLVVREGESRRAKEYYHAATTKKNRLAI